MQIEGQKHVSIGGVLEVVHAILCGSQGLNHVLRRGKPQMALYLGKNLLVKP